MKLLTELTTLDAFLATVAICAAEGLDDRAATELLSASTDEVMALVSLGKSLFAELTTVLASLWMVLTCDSRPLTPLLAFKLVSPLTEFCRLVRSEQYAGLPLLQPARTTTPIAATNARRTRAHAPPWRARDLPEVALILIVLMAPPNRG